MNAAVPYVIAGAAFYGLDRILRLVKSRLCTATLTCLPELHMTQIYIPQLNSGWRAGQHVRLRVLSLGMGWRGWAETHPFTIANVLADTRGAPHDVQLVFRVRRGLTKELQELALTRPRGRLLLDGPYGGTKTDLALFAHVLLITGGAGVTFVVPLLQDLVARARAGEEMECKSVHLIWSVREEGSYFPLAVRVSPASLFIVS